MAKNSQKGRAGSAQALWSKSDESNAEIIGRSVNMKSIIKIENRRSGTQLYILSVLITSINIRKCSKILVTNYRNVSILLYNLLVSKNPPSAMELQNKRQSHIKTNSNVKYLSEK